MQDLNIHLQLNGQPTDYLVVPETKPWNRAELSKRLQDLIVTSLIPSHLKCHTRKPGASQGLYLNGESETDIGAVMAF
nr:hypothetical protein CFP56_53050 [Quercus suber]